MRDSRALLNIDVHTAIHGYILCMVADRDTNALQGGNHVRSQAHNPR
jgi:hypothetical protein